ncbi:MAG: Imm50 family immunity protein [Bryobacteraceae bacterium]
MKALLDRVPGLADLVQWCNGWPSFHDAEIVRLDLRRRGLSQLVVYALGGARPDVGPRADPKYSVPPEDVIITFVLEDIDDLDLYQFSSQNVVFSLSLEATATGLRITMQPCYGLAGTIDAQKISIKFSPGKPKSDE